VPRPSGPLDPLRELQATLPLGVAVLMRCGLVRDTEERENRLRCAKPAVGRWGCERDVGRSEEGLTG
jgi:hypothetical protein